jgi:hypothetical protein
VGKSLENPGGGGKERRRGAWETPATPPAADLSGGDLGPAEKKNFLGGDVTGPGKTLPGLSGTHRPVFEKFRQPVDKTKLGRWETSRPKEVPALADTAERTKLDGGPETVQCSEVPMPADTAERILRYDETDPVERSLASVDRKLIAYIEAVTPCPF